MKKIFVLILLSISYLFALDVFVGVTLKDVNEYVTVDEEARNRVLITDVLPDSPADKADIKVGYILLEADKNILRDVEDFLDILKEKKPDENLRLTVLDENNTKISKDIKLIDRKDFYETHKQLFSEYLIYTIGVHSTSINDQLAEFFQVPNGVLVTFVEKDSPVNNLKAGDIITAVNGKKVFTVVDFENYLNEQNMVKLKLNRKGETKYEKVIVQKKKIPYPFYSIKETPNANEIEEYRSRLESLETEIQELKQALSKKK